MSEAKIPKRRIKGNALRNWIRVGAAALMLKGGYDVTTDYVMPAGRSTVNHVQQMGRDFADMRDYQSRLNGAPSTYIDICSSSDDFEGELKLEAIDRGIKNPRKIDRFVERVLNMNCFEPDGSDSESYGWIVARDTERRADEENPEIVGEHGVTLELKQGKDGRLSYGARNTSFQYSTGTFDTFSISIPDINYNKDVAAARARNTNNLTLGARKPRREARAPTNSYAEARPTQANHYGGRK